MDKSKQIMKGVFGIFLYLTVVSLHSWSCENSHVVREHYDNGKLKSTTEMVGRKKHGVSKEYDVNGGIYQEIHWKNDTIDGDVFVYFSNGKLREKHKLVMGKHVGKSTMYYQNGGVAEEKYFDSAGMLIDVRSYNKSGNQDYDVVSPIAHFARDSVPVGGQIDFFAKLVNADPQLYKNGTLIVTSKLDKHKDPIDTIFMTNSTNDVGFKYSFTAEKEGVGSIIGLLIFTIPTDSGSVYSIFDFSTRYYVRPE